MVEKDYEGKKLIKSKNEIPKIPNLTYKTSIEFSNTTEDFYTLRKNGNLDKAVINAFDNPKVEHVLITGELKLDDQIIYVSDSFNRLAFESVIEGDSYFETEQDRDFEDDSEDGQLFYQALVNKLGSNVKYDGFELINIHVRTVYKTEL